MKPRSKDWHISGWPAVILAPVLVPVALLIRLLPFKKTRDRSASEVVSFLRDFMEGTGGSWDWDDFTSIPITSPTLDAIRVQASLIELPVSADGEKRLRELLTQAEANGRSSSLERIPKMGEED